MTEAAKAPDRANASSADVDPEIENDEAISAEMGRTLRTIAGKYPRFAGGTVTNEYGSITVRIKQPRDRMVKRGR